MKLGDAILFLLLDDTKLKAGLTSAGKGIQSWGTSVGKAVAKGVVVATAAVTALGLAIFKVSKEAALSAARVEELELVLEVIGKNAGVSTEFLYEQVDAIKELGITTQVALGLVTTFTRFQLNAADATKLARVAQDAAVISMQDSSQALDGLMHGIATMNTRVLRTYGITIGSTIDLQDDFAATLGKTRDELTQQEKMQAVLNAVLKQGESIAGAYEASMEAAGKRLRSMKRWVTELLNKMGKPLLGAFSSAIDIGTDFLKMMNKAAEEGGWLNKTMVMMGEVMSFLFSKVGKRLADWMSGIPALMERITMEWTWMKQAFEEGGIFNVFDVLFGAETGEKIRKVATRILEVKIAFQDFIDNTIMPFVTKHGPELQEWFMNFGAALAGLAAFGMILKIAGAIAGLVNPITLIAGAIALVVTAWNNDWGNIKGITQAAIDFLREKWEEFGPGIVERLTATWEAIKSVFNTAWPIIVAGAQQGIQWIKDKWAEYGPSAIEAITGAWTKIKTTFETWWPIIVSSVQTGVQFLKDKWAEYGPPVIEMLTGAWDEIKRLFTEGPDFLKERAAEIVQFLKDKWAEWGPHVTPLFQATWETIKRIFRDEAETLKGFVEKALTKINELWDKWGPTIREIAQNTWDTITQVFENAKEMLKDTMDLLTAALEGRWFDVGVKLREIWDNAMENLRLGFENAKETFLLILDEIKQAIVDKIGGRSWKELGHDIILGIVDGLREFGHKVGDAMLTVGQAAVDIFRGFFGMQSPSTLMIKDGKNIVKGTEEGVEEQGKSLMRTFDELAADIASRMAQATQPATDASRLTNNTTTNETNIDATIDFKDTTLDENTMQDAFEVIRLLRAPTNG